MMDEPGKQPHSRVLGAGITAAVTGLYLVLAFRGWRSFEELIALFPPFAVLALFVGFVVAGLPLSRPIRTTFFATFPTPLLALFVYQFVNVLIPYAHAGFTGGSIFSGGQLFAFSVVFFLLVGLLFSLLASLGCYLGLSFRQVICSRFEGARGRHAFGTAPHCSDKTVSRTATESDTVRAARLGAWATVVVGLVGSFTTLATALITTGR